MASALVARHGTVCAVAFSGSKAEDRSASKLRSTHSGTQLKRHSRRKISGGEDDAIFERSWFPEVPRGRDCQIACREDFQTGARNEQPYMSLPSGI